MGILLLLLALCARFLYISRKSGDLLGAYIGVGLFGTFAFQSIINIGMNLSILPVIGITLPLFSAGGTSVLTLYLGIGLALSVYMHNREHLFMN